MVKIDEGRNEIHPLSQRNGHLQPFEIGIVEASTLPTDRISTG